MGRLVLPRSALVSIDPIFFLVSFIAIRQTYSKYRSIVYTPTMAYSMLESGLQASILCGPGNSFGNLLNTEKTPKCLAFVANRPMVYYSLDFSKRSGITDVTLITPPSALAPIKAALEKDSFLNSISLPKVLGPQDLLETMTTTDLLRLPEVQAYIQSNFLLLPCDLVCDIGESLLEHWVLSGTRITLNCQGGLCLYYKADVSVKDEILDLVAVASPKRTDISSTSNHELSKLVISMGMDTIKSKMGKEKSFSFRRSFTEKHDNFRLLAGYRDAHLYFFPYWVKDLIRRQERLDSVKEDLIGFWAKSQWQQGLGEKLGIEACLRQLDESQEVYCQDVSTSTHGISQNDLREPGPIQHPMEIPPLLAYLQTESAQLTRRVDNPALLLSTSLYLAKIDSKQDIIFPAQPASFSHDQKFSYPRGLSEWCSISKADCLLASEVVVEKNCVIKETYIGPNSKTCSGSRLTRCVILDNVAIGECCVLSGCIVGGRSLVGRRSVLEDCQIQEGYTVPEETDAKN